jgi:succinate dehydrogenase / fumarate reductase cytochrome b subunit
MTDPSPHSRPLSPHLQVYRLPMTALMSISHRITGVILAGGCVLITAFLVAAAMGAQEYDFVMALAGTWLGKAFLFAWLFVLYYHLCNGIRHLIWDTVHLLGEKQAVAAGWVVLLATILMTLATWHCAMDKGL